MPNTMFCEECGKPGAKGGYVTLSSERLYLRAHPECKKAVKARYDAWLASEEGQAAAAFQARVVDAAQSA